MTVIVNEVLSKLSWAFFDQRVFILMFIEIVKVIYNTEGIFKEAEKNDIRKN